MILMPFFREFSKKKKKINHILPVKVRSSADSDQTISIGEFTEDSNVTAGLVLTT